MSYVGLNLLYNAEFDKTADANGVEIRSLDVAQQLSRLTSYNFGSLLANKRVVIFSAVGAFRDPTKPLDYNNRAFEIKELGVDDIICHTVNDPWVVSAWASHLNVPDINFIADGNGYLANRLGMWTDMSEENCGWRSWSYAAVVNNGIIEYFVSEPDMPIDVVIDKNPDMYEATNSQNIINYLSGTLGQ